MKNHWTLKSSAFVMLEKLSEQFTFPMYVVTSLPKRFTDLPYIVCIAFDEREADIFAYQGNYKVWKVRHGSDFNQIKRFYDLFE